MKKTSKILFVILLIALVIGAGLYIYQNKNSSENLDHSRPSVSGGGGGVPSVQKSSRLP